MKNTATIILNRNLPDVTDRLCELISSKNNTLTDIFVVESGSDQAKLSRHCTWWANWEEAMAQGLRPPRGFNYGLQQLWLEGRFQHYDNFFLVTNDTEFGDYPFLEILLEELDKHRRVGILSPCSRRWGERGLLQHTQTRYFWYVLNTALLVRRAFVESVMTCDEPTHINFLYDGSNFRGFGTELELIAKGYANEWATAITSAVLCEENESHLRHQADVIRTESYEKNMRLVVDEGKQWMYRKYGFKNRWTMQLYAKAFYDMFFQYFPELTPYKI